MTVTCRLIKQALGAYVFFRAAGPDREQAYACLREIWSACQDHLEMGEAIPSLGLPTELPASAGPAYGPSTARRPAASGCGNRASTRTAHPRHLQHGRDAAPEPSSGIGWQQLDQQWSALTKDVPPGALVGEARLYLALLDCDDEPRAVGGSNREAGEAPRRADASFPAPHGTCRARCPPRRTRGTGGGITDRRPGRGSAYGRHLQPRIPAPDGGSRYRRRGTGNRPG